MNKRDMAVVKKIKEDDAMERKDGEIKEKRMFYYKDGKLFFNREAERMVYFIITLGMAGACILIKLGIF